MGIFEPIVRGGAVGSVTGVCGVDEDDAPPDGEYARSNRFTMGLASPLG
jgi:hypothetical protein